GKLPPIKDSELNQFEKTSFFKDVFDAVYQCSQRSYFLREKVDLYRPTKSMKAITNPIGSSCSADRIFLSSLQACRITNQASYLQN
ncbi:hypothetical protein, partial [Escherichia coli]|uniref:hypothetical protein n=1 Tax=Escherichia coli TaxID=562 RepID=UPI001BFC66E6